MELKCTKCNAGVQRPLVYSKLTFLANQEFPDKVAAHFGRRGQALDIGNWLMQNDLSPYTMGGCAQTLKSVLESLQACNCHDVTLCTMTPDWQPQPVVADSTVRERSGESRAGSLARPVLFATVTSLYSNGTPMTNSVVHTDLPAFGSYRAVKSTSPCMGDAVVMECLLPKS